MSTIIDAIRNTSIVSVSSEQKKTIQVISIGAAIFFTLSYSFYDRYLLPPRNIRHLPRWKYSDFIKNSILKKKENGSKKISKNGSNTNLQKDAKAEQAFDNNGITLV